MNQMTDTERIDQMQQRIWDGEIDQQSAFDELCEYFELDPKLAKQECRGTDLGQLSHYVGAYL